MEQENVKLEKKLTAQKKLYDDLKKAYYMTEKRLQDRIDYLKDENRTLKAAKVSTDKELGSVAKHTRGQHRKNESNTNVSGNIARLENFLWEKDRELAIAAHDLLTYRRENRELYDMASDTQHYAILIERLLKADKDRHIIWPHRLFEVSLKGIKE